MRPSVGTACAAAAVAALVGAGLLTACASVLGIPNDTASFCASNPGHDYCEDFDIGDAGSRWTFAETFGGATIAVAPSDLSPPNLIDLSTPSQPEGGSGLAGFTREFDQSPFTGVHVEMDMRFVTQPGQPVKTNGGILIVVDKSGGCIGIGLGTFPGGGSGLGAVIFPEPTACSALTGGGQGPSQPPQGGVLAATPPANQWFRVVMIVTPDPSGNGAGTLSFDVVGQPGSVPVIPIPAGTLPATGTPLVGFASEVNGPSDGLEVQYDNVTIDLKGD